MVKRKQLFGRLKSFTYICLVQFKINKMKRKSKVEIINETIEFYKTHNRGLTENEVCSYLTNKGDKCAVGRCAIRPERLERDGRPASIIPNFDNKIKNRYKGHDVSFWQELQYFHDSGFNWFKNSTNGWDLTHNGLLEYKRLIKMYSTAVNKYEADLEADLDEIRNELRRNGETDIELFVF